MAKIKVNNTPVRYVGDQMEKAYFCLTDMVKDLDGESNYYLRSWLRNQATLNFIEVWEKEFNPDFKTIEFDSFKLQAGQNSFMPSVAALTDLGCKGMFSKKGKYGGTYAHVAIAFHFANWLSPQFYLGFIIAFIENNAFSVKRLWSRLNYRLHTEGVKAALPSGLNRSTKGLQYASEADLLNIAVFERTAKEWREQNPNTAGNQRDHASPAQLHVLANLEMLNAYLLKKQMAKDERAYLLLQEADYQFSLLFSVDEYKR